MKYVTQELELNLPEPFQDRSVNALLLGGKQPPDFNLVISRDIIPRGENLDSVVKKQIKTISSTQENFKETQPGVRRTLLHSDGTQINAIELGIRYKNVFIVSAVNYPHEQKNLPKRYQSRAICASPSPDGKCP